MILKEKQIYPIFFLALITLAINVTAVQQLDATMCTKSDEELEALVTGCMANCQTEWDNTQKANYLLNEQASNRDCTSEWLSCGRQCPPGVATGDGMGMDYSQKMACENQCMTGYDNCEAAVSAAMGMMGVTAPDWKDPLARTV